MPQIKLTSSLPEDAAKVRAGIDGSEPDQVIRQLRKISPGGAFVSICFPTFYPSVEGGFFVNTHLIEALQRSFQNERVVFVLDDVCRMDGGLVPYQCPGSLALDELYVVFHDQRPVAHALCWKYDAGGGDYYNAQFVVQFIVSAGARFDLKALLLRSLQGTYRVSDFGMTTTLT